MSDGSRRRDVEGILEKKLAMMVQSSKGPSIVKESEAVKKSTRLKILGDVDL